MEKATARYDSGRYAAIDIGTVTARLLVADVADDGALTELARDHAICNLGVGVDKTGLLDPHAIGRVAEAVGRFVQTIGSLQPEGEEPVRVIAKATSASRDAENSGEFVSALAKLGVDLQVIPGESEAALSFSGATSAFPGEKVVVLDVGGGSSEIIAGEAGGLPQHAHSFNIGCRRVTERYFQSDPPSSGELADAGEWIAEEMADFLGTVARDGYASCRTIAVAGTATSIISMREQMEVYDSDRVHGSTATLADVDGLLGKLAGMTLDERKQVVGLDPGRAPVIVAGLLIIRQIMGVLGIDSITVSERDILHGIILDAARVRRL